MPNGMECIFQCENESSKVSHHHAICVKDESTGDHWQWQLFKLNGQVEDSMPFYESELEFWSTEMIWILVTCQDNQLFDDFLASLLSENSLENARDCPPVEQNFGILGNPLISCSSSTQCNFFCLNGLLIGAASVSCGTSLTSQSPSWIGDNGESFVACIKLF